MKLIIQIPCHNEEKALPVTLEALPRELPGVDSIEWLVIDDGSTDGTMEAARAGGVDHVVRFTRRRGLAAAFTAGLDAALSAGADIIVNTDADNQYHAGDIPRLIDPILEGKADMVIGERPIQQIERFSPAKKLLQWMGSRMVSLMAGTNIPDAPSGFRALSRETALRVNVFSGYTYTLETIIQAGKRGTTVLSVPVRVNEDLRPSRLVKSIGSYVSLSAATMLRSFLAYRPLRFFTYIGALILAAGMLIGARFVYYWWIGAGEGKIQSLILAAVLLVSGFQCCLVGLLADVLAVNRRLLEDIQYRVRSMEHSQDD